MRQGNGQRIGGIGRGRFRQLQKTLNHLGHGKFLRSAVADQRLLHLARSDLKNLQSRFRQRRQRRSARFAHDQRRLQILREEQTFNGANIRLMLRNHVAQRDENLRQAPRTLPPGGTLDRAVSQRARRRFAPWITP